MKNKWYLLYKEGKVFSLTKIKEKGDIIFYECSFKIEDGIFDMNGKYGGNAFEKINKVDDNIVGVFIYNYYKKYMEQKNIKPIYMGCFFENYLEEYKFEDNCFWIKDNRKGDFNYNCIFEKGKLATEK